MMIVLLLAASLLQTDPSPSEWVRRFAQGNDAESASAREKLAALGLRIEKGAIEIVERK